MISIAYRTGAGQSVCKPCQFTGDKTSECSEGFHKDDDRSTENGAHYAKSLCQDILRNYQGILAHVIETGCLWLDSLLTLCNKKLGTPLIKYMTSLRSCMDRRVKTFDFNNTKLCDAEETMQTIVDSNRNYNTICVLTPCANRNVVPVVKKTHVIETGCLWLDSLLTLCNKKLGHTAYKMHDFLKKLYGPSSSRPSTLTIPSSADAERNYADNS
ncbi:hypothetical protein ACJJTC_014308 [Scirpophaga incertulas]